MHAAIVCVRAHLELAYKLLQAVRRRQVARFVVDGMEAFRQSALYPERLGRFSSPLTNEQSGAGATTLEPPRGTDLPSRLSPVSAIAQRGVSAAGAG